MTAASRKLMLAFLVALLVAAATASAALAIKFVASDIVSFKGTYNGGTGFFVSQKCSLKSDGETTAFPCGVEGGANPQPIGGQEIEVGSHWASADGEGTIRGARLKRSSTSKPPVEIYEGFGACFESEETEPGSGQKTSYPCLTKIRLTFNTAKKTVAGTYAVKEESGLP